MNLFSNDYTAKVDALEAEGLTTSDAQAAIEAQQMTAAQRYGYRMKRDRDNAPRAESEIKLEDVAAEGREDAGVRMLKLSTSKGSRGGISSFASVCVRRYSNGYQTETSALFQDYAKWYNATPCKRVTEKAIEAAHRVALETFAEHIAAAKLQYNID